MNERPQEPIEGPAGQSPAELSPLTGVDPTLPFGPAFFYTYLRGMIRAHCTEPVASPSVDLRLQGGEVLHLCHIVGLAPSWIALAVGEMPRSTAMRLEIVPYTAISRVTVRGAPLDEAAIGFAAEHRPLVVEPRSCGKDLMVALTLAAEGPAETSDS